MRYSLTVRERCIAQPRASAETVTGRVVPPSELRLRARARTRNCSTSQARCRPRSARDICRCLHSAADHSPRCVCAWCFSTPTSDCLCDLLPLQFASETFRAVGAFRNRFQVPVSFVETITLVVTTERFEHFERNRLVPILRSVLMNPKMYVRPLCFESITNVFFLCLGHNRSVSVYCLTKHCWSTVRALSRTLSNALFCLSKHCRPTCISTPSSPYGVPPRSGLNIIIERSAASPLLSSAAIHRTAQHYHYYRAQ